MNSPIRISLASALENAHDLAYNIGPITSGEPEEVAEWWIRGANEIDFADIVATAMLPGTYYGAATCWNMLEVFLEAWAEFDSVHCFETMKGLLSDLFARQAALAALSAVLRRDFGFAERVTTELNAAIGAWPPLSKDEAMILEDMVWQFEREPAGDPSVLDPRLIQAAKVK